MWPWRRRSPVQRMAETASAAPAAPATPPARTPAWSGLPPIQRSLGDPPLVNPPGRFTAGLAAWRTFAYLEPLGHAVGPDQPAGLIGDIATVDTSGAAGPVHAAGSEPAGGPDLTRTRPEDGAPRPPARRTAQRSAESAPPAVVASQPVSAPPYLVAPEPDLPAVSLSVVAREGGPARPTPGLARQDSGPAAVPVVQRSAEPVVQRSAAHAPTPVEHEAAPAGPEGTEAPAPPPVPAESDAMAPTLGEPVVPPAVESPLVAPRHDQSGEPGPDLPVAGAPTVQRSLTTATATGAPRRLGLGEPIVPPPPRRPAAPESPEPPPVMTSTVDAGLRVSRLVNTPESRPEPLASAPEPDSLGGDQDGAPPPIAPPAMSTAPLLGAEPPGPSATTPVVAGPLAAQRSEVGPSAAQQPSTGPTATERSAGSSTTKSFAAQQSPQPPPAQLPPAGPPSAGPPPAEPPATGLSAAGSRVPESTGPAAPEVDALALPLQRRAESDRPTLGAVSAVPVVAQALPVVAQQIPSGKALGPAAIEPLPSSVETVPTQVVARLVGDAPITMLPAQSTRERQPMRDRGPVREGQQTGASRTSVMGQPPPVQRVGGEPVGGSGSPAQVDRSPEPDLPVAVPPAAAVPIAGRPANDLSTAYPSFQDAWTPPVVQRADEPATAAAPASGELPDGELPGGEPVSGAPADVPPADVAAGGGAPAGTGQAGQAGGTPVEPEELLKKLFDPLLRRLKTELRLDRERYGALTDRA